MESEDFKFEEFLVAKALGLSLHRFDFVLDSFQRAGGDGIVVPGEDAQGRESQGKRTGIEEKGQA